MKSTENFNYPEVRWILGACIKKKKPKKLFFCFEVEGHRDFKASFDL